MSAELPLFTSSWKVGRRHTVTLTVQRPQAGRSTNAVIEWTPAKPAHLTRAQLADYRTGRDQALAQMARESGLRVALLEVAG